MRTRLYDARILTMEPDRDIFKGEIWVLDGKIEKIICSDMENHKSDTTEAPSFDREIDCMGNLIMPGFVNCHAHGPMTFLRSYADDLPLQEWLHNKIFPAEGCLRESDIETLMELAILEYVRNGITTSFEMYFYPEMIAKACNRMGFPVVISGTVFGETKESVDGAVNTLRDDYKRFHGAGEFVDYRLGFHSEYSCCFELLEAISDLCKELKAPVYMHNSETEREVEDCKKRYGKTPIRLMHDLGLFRYGGAGHHLVHTTPEDWEIMKEDHIFAVTNPASNMKLASGIAPLKDYLHRNIPVAIGTDGPASNNSLNFFKEMYLACGCAKLKYKDASAVTPMEILRMATVNGADLLGLHSGCLQEGKSADLILLDLLKPNMQPLNHMVPNIVYSGSTDNVLMTMIHGNIVYANQHYYMNVEPIDIYREANCIIRRIELESNMVSS